jgi:predicted  nucleic acid-binding Zn-ribbon protein
VRDSEDHFVELVGRQSRRENEKSTRKAKSEYAKAENRFRQLDDIIAQIYEDKVGGELSAERFAKMLGKYEQEQTDLTAKMDALRPLLEEAEEQSHSTDRFLRMVKRFTEIKSLTAEVVNEFIERIEIGETVVIAPRKHSHWKDEKQQSIRIVYNYIGAVPQAGEAVSAETREKTTTAM